MYPIIKRSMDIILSSVALLILWPLYLLITVLIKVDTKGPIFFKQKRVGKDKKHFYILKFRTMRTDTPGELPTHMLHNPDEYITKVGKFLRKASLDELPQLLNIIKGEMSIVGPRPALWNQIDLITKRDEYGANDLTPGLTGWAQVNGRDELPIEVKARFDGEYVERISLVTDMNILIKTLMIVVRSEGVQEGIRQSGKEESL
jgi:O-antigen biosynthesis protein WbqP